MDVEWGQVVQTVLEAVLALVLPVAVGYAVTWIRAQRAALMAKMDENQRWMLTQAVEIAVRAAEQSGLRDAAMREGAVKKQYALNLAEQYLERWGLSIDLEVLSGMVEAEVLRQFSLKEPIYRTLPVVRDDTGNAA